MRKLNARWGVLPFLLPLATTPDDNVQQTFECAPHTKSRRPKGCRGCLDASLLRSSVGYWRCRSAHALRRTIADTELLSKGDVVVVVSDIISSGDTVRSVQLRHV